MMVIATYSQDGAVVVASNGDAVCSISAEAFEVMDGRVPAWLKDWLALGNEISPYMAPPPTADDVIRERARRLALGFDYDFGDARGVHRIGTTPEDMIGWDEVAKGSQAAIALGAPETPIHIVTDTGAVTVSALEFQGILAAATTHRQPIWAASFALQAMNPIPADYADNAWWEETP